MFANQSKSSSKTRTSSPTWKVGRLCVRLRRLPTNIVNPVRVARSITAGYEARLARMRSTTGFHSGVIGFFKTSTTPSSLVASGTEAFTAPAMATINRDRLNLLTEVELETELLFKPPPPATLEVLGA